MALLLLGFSTLFFGLGTLPFIGADEPRYARIAEEMRLQGRWVTPTLEAHPWLEKPPLYYWLTRPFLSLPVTPEVAARLGPAFCALLAALAICWLGGRIWTPRAGLLGGAILLTSIGFLAFARSASTDMPLTACLTVALSLLATAALERSRGKMAAAAVLLGLAVLAKGPVALILAFGIALLFWVFDERGPSFRLPDVLMALGITFAVAFPWFWLAFRQNGFAFVSMFLINHNLARYISDVHHHSEPVYYYLGILPALMFPWTGWLPALIPAARAAGLRRWREWDRGTLYLICWTVFPLLFFSASRSKLSGYILPALPPLALLLGRAVDQLQETRAAWRWKNIIAWCVLASSAAVALGLVLLFDQYGGNWKVGLMLCVPVLAPVCWAVPALRGNAWAGALLATILCGVSVIVVVSLFAAPVLGRYHSTRELAYTLTAHRLSGEPAVTYRFFHHTLDYYTGFGISANLDDRDALVQFAAEHRSFLLVTETHQLAELQSLPGCSVIPVGAQGKLCLVRIIVRLS